jgi:molecular chaperone GrpE (heat shock protein)
MTPEELEATREGANVEYAPDIAYDDWQAMARALLAHIDAQAAQISDLKQQIITLSDSVVSVESRKDRQIEALKEKLVEERAKILMVGEDDVEEAWEYLRDNPRFAVEAHRQLKTEMPGLEWE